MEYASEGSLFQLVARRNRLPEEDAFYFFIQTVCGLHFLKKHNLIHRDIKPENLLLTKRNEIKVCDFGWCTKTTNRGSER
jgi:serine/threonine protein kinase